MPEFVEAYKELSFRATSKSDGGSGWKLNRVSNLTFTKEYMYWAHGEFHHQRMWMYVVSLASLQFGIPGIPGSAIAHRDHAQISSLGY